MQRNDGCERVFGSESAMKIKVHLLAILFAFGISGPPAVMAQQSVTSATLTGRIEDVNGAGITGATVTVVNLETGQALTTESNAGGNFRFPYLRVGKYNFSVTAEGFSKVTRELTAAVGQALDLPVQLEVETLSAHVNVMSTVPLVETVRTQVTETVDPEEIMTCLLTDITSSISLSWYQRFRRQTPEAINASPKRRRCRVKVYR